MRRLLRIAALTVFFAESLGGGTLPASASGNVLLVGPPGYPNAQYTSIQSAVNAAAAGDWILIAPGVYHEKGGNFGDSRAAGVLITTRGSTSAA